MSIKNIIITDILELDKIDNNTPILIVKNIPSSYLISIDTNVYWIDINKLHTILAKQIDFIYDFVPIGQIKTNKNYFTTILANTKLIPTTESYEKIKNNEWVAIIKKQGKINRSVGTFKSVDKPIMNIPVFPITFLQKYNNTSFNNSTYKDLYSHKNFGKWIFNKYMFNIDKSNLKMIDSSGNISNMYIPDSNINIYDEKEEASKIFFTTQGNISNDDKYIITSAYDTANSSLQEYKIDNKNKLLKKNKTLFLREKENPWFLDYAIVGEAINTDNPSKVTGITPLSNPLDVMSLNTNNSIPDTDNQTSDNLNTDNLNTDNLNSDNQTSDNQTSDNLNSDNLNSDNQTSNNLNSNNLSNGNYNNSIILIISCLILLFIICKMLKKH